MKKKKSQEFSYMEEGQREDSAQLMSDDAGLSSGGLLVRWFPCTTQLSVVCKSPSG